MTKMASHDQTQCRGGGENFPQRAKEMGCDQSQQRFQDVLFAIGRDKPLRRASKSPKVSRKAKRSR
jgi:hypothetical protein